jgi:hypothetical protein
VIELLQIGYGSCLTHNNPISINPNLPELLVQVESIKQLATNARTEAINYLRNEFSQAMAKILPRGF